MLLRNKISIVVVSCIVVILLGIYFFNTKTKVDLNTQYQGVQEDIYIMQAYAALDAKDYALVQENFMQAYKISNDRKYLQEIIAILILQKDFQTAKIRALEYLQKNPKDEEVRQVLVEILGNMGDLQGAAREVQILLENNKSAQNLEIASSICFLQKDYNQALKYLQEAYQKTKSEKMLDKIVSAYLLVFKDKNSAIMAYEEHISKYGVSQNIGEKLALIYIEERKPLRAAKVYEKLYLETKEQKYARFALEIYFQNQNLTEAERFLEKNQEIEQRDEILLEVYRLRGEKTKSIPLLQKLYEESGNVDYLALEAIMLYENSTDKNQAFLKKIAGKFEEVLEESDNPLYFNYLGYLLIDHNLDVKKGIKYVQKALEKEPQNPYYLDSLAWGYYKLRDCKNAKEIMDKIPQQEREQEKEIKEHFEVISKCKF